MLDAGKVQTLRDACARGAGLRQRLEASPDEVLRAYGVLPETSATRDGLVRAILAGELSEAELAAAVGVLSLPFDFSAGERLVALYKELEHAAEPGGGGRPVRRRLWSEAGRAAAAVVDGDGVVW